MFARYCIFSLLIGMLLASCADTSTFVDGSMPADTTGDVGLIYDFVPGESGSYPGTDRVFAHSASELFKIDPDTLQVSKVADFGWPAGVTDQMTDIALDKLGSMIGISFDKVYSVDPDTAQCTTLAPLSREFNGLSFIAPASAEGKEYLMATALDGSVFEINPQTGQSRTVGSFGGGLTSSGDLVSVKGFGTVATVESTMASSDLLAMVDPVSGAAQVIGETGFVDVWGLGFWKGKVYGFTEVGEFILIDVQTGAGTLVSSSNNAWWGAGVTTEAPLIE
jgi:hypothetical protein